jgi:biotin carboxyl carrier protein
MKYVVLIDGQSIEVEVDGDHVTLAGDTHDATLNPIPGTPLRQLMLDGRPLTLSVEPLGRGHWAIALGGERFEVEVLDERTRHIRSLTGSGDQRRAVEVLKAPMPGLVVRVEAKEGDSVTAGAGLVVLEAMKMENELKAGRAGTVAEVRVEAGQAVNPGDVLIVITESS